MERNPQQFVLYPPLDKVLWAGETMHIQLKEDGSAWGPTAIVAIMGAWGDQRAMVEVLCLGGSLRL